MASEAEYDAFERFDRAAGADKVRDPYPGYAKARLAGPVQEVDLVAVLGEAAKMFGDNPPEVYQVLTHQAVAQVLRDGKRFSSSNYAQSMGVVMGPTILVMDEPEHGRYRGLIQTAFSKKALERWEEELVGPVVDDLVDAFAKRGHAELIRELTFPFPVRVIAGMLGLPREDLPRFHQWAVELISVGFDWERGLAGSKHLGDYLLPLIEERRKERREDLISVLAHAELDGLRLDDQHILGFLRLLLPAGAETTYRSSSNLLFGLLQHPEQLAALREDRSLMDQAIEEGLRWETPLTGISRLCTQDTDVCGTVIPAGATVQVNLGAANRDASRYERPDEFDLFRPRRQHMAFAFGPHRCLGMHLARMETRVVVDALLDRLPNLRTDPAAEDVHITGQVFRAPRRLPVVFDA